MLPEIVPKLQTNRFALKVLSPDDLPDFFHFVETEPELWQYALTPCNDRTSMQAYVDSAIEGMNLGNTLPFVVVNRQTGKLVGSTRLYEFFPHLGTTLLGYTWYSKHEQGNGINTHCKFLLLNYVFETLGFERVELRADTRNARSIAAMRKIGFIEEGILRSHLPVGDGTRRDSIVFSMLKDEWKLSKVILEQRLV